MCDYDDMSFEEEGKKILVVYECRWLKEREGGS